MRNMPLQSMNKRAVLIGLAFLLAAVFLLRLDVFDSFYHGYFTDAVSYDRVDADSVLGTYNLADGEMNLSFVPLKRVIWQDLCFILKIPRTIQAV